MDVDCCDKLGPPRKSTPMHVARKKKFPHFGFNWHRDDPVVKRHFDCKIDTVWLTEVQMAKLRLAVREMYE